MNATTIKEFRLPDLGEGLTESEIIEWKVAVGDTVELNQVIAEVETAKAVVELPSPYAGTITELHEEPGTVVEVGARIVSFALPSTGEAFSAANPDSDSAPVEDERQSRRVPTLVGYGAEAEKTGRPQRTPRGHTAQQSPPSGHLPSAVAALPGSQHVPAAKSERPRSTPPVRKLARDYGLNLESILGTGPAGLVTRQDVLTAVGGNVSSPVTPSEPLGKGAAELDSRQSRIYGAPVRETRMSIKGVRKHTAAAMVASAFTAPHVTEFLTIDATPAMELLAQLRQSREFAGYKLTPLTLVAKAVCIAAQRQPSLNSRWDEANQEIVTMHYVNLGIAAATPRGLIVPNIKDAHSLHLKQLAAELNSLADRARAGKTSPAELAGGTISITNIGVFGIDAGTPILNPGEAAILAMGTVRRQPWEHEGQVALRDVMTLSLSFDHRLVDGEQGSRFLADVGAILAQPGVAISMV